MTQRHRSEISTSVSADPLGRDRRTPRTYRSGRQCAVAECQTVLSIYNGAKHCAAHNIVSVRAAGRRSRSPGAEAATLEAPELVPAPAERTPMLDYEEAVSRRAS
jgi:hypothetical protein